MDNYGEKAVALFATGLNCAQSVYCAFAEDFGMDAETAAKVSSGLGGGVGRLREVCGAVTGATLVLGMKYGPDKTAVYEKVQEFAAIFKQEMGTIICRELLDGTGATSGGAPEARTPEYYKKRPCAEIVRFAADTVSRMLSA